MHTSKSPRSAERYFVKKCKFGFPRPFRDTSCLNCVEDSLKTKGKLYHLKRTEDEVKINDYNPLLLKGWKANMDIQYIAESTLALAHYVSGYVYGRFQSNGAHITWKGSKVNYLKLT